MMQTLKQYLLQSLHELMPLTPEMRIEQRIEKFSKMGFYEEV
jgi:acetyl-CoA carboxylase carboxyl transferase subunit alpha